MKRKIKVLMVATIIICSILAAPVLAQTVADRIVISAINTSAELFPAVQLTAVALDSQGMPVRGITPGMLVLQEDGESVEFTLEETTSGIRTVLVLDMGRWINLQGYGTGKLVKDLMQDTALRFINAMQPEDLVELIVVYKHDPVVVQAFTSDKEELRQAVTNLEWESDEVSFGIESIRTAGANLEKAPDDLARHILYISAGTMDRDRSSPKESVLAQGLKAKKITVNSIYIKGEGAFQYFKTISDITGGQFIQYLVGEDPEASMPDTSNYRPQYRLTYQSKSIEPGLHTVTLGLSGGGTAETGEYTIDPAWIPAPGIEMIVNNNNPVVIGPDAASIPVPIHVVVHDLGYLQINRVVYFVNGQEQGALNASGPETFTGTWNISAGAYPVGGTSVTLEVLAEDDRGRTYHSSMMLDVTVEAQAAPPARVDPFCRNLANLPGIGMTLSASCQGGVFTLAHILNVFLLAVVLALGILLWFQRDQVKQFGKEAGTKVKKVYDRLTHRNFKQEPKARLVAVQGIPDGDRQEFDIFGETPIGRSREVASLLFDNENVSRLHCIIHEGHAGIWTVEDQESSNFTYLNGRKLDHFKERELNHNDILELGQAERGGIKFRFEILETIIEEPEFEVDGELNPDGIDDTRNTTPNRSQPAPVDDRPTAVIRLEQESDVKETQRNKVIETDLRPSDPTRQRW